MHLDNRHCDRFDRIVQRDRGMGVSPRVQQHRLRTRAMRLVQPIDQMAFMVGLAKINVKTLRLRLIVQPSGNIIERVGAVNLWLPRAEQIEVGSVEDENDGAISQWFLAVSLRLIVASPYMVILGNARIVSVIMQLPDFNDYIVFIDESGSPVLDPIDPDYPIFVLVFCVVKKDVYANAIQPAFKRLKFKYFGHDMTALHSHAIRKPRGEYAFLQDARLREAFLIDLTELFEQSDFSLLVHVIDKVALKKRYARPFDPYDIALRMNMEQLTIFLGEKQQGGKLCHLVAESRGKKEDDQLELEFRRVLNPEQGWGNAPRFSFANMPMSLKFVEKKINSAGLQIADLAAQPIGRNLLKPEQQNRAFDAVQNKIHRRIWRFPET